MGRWWLGIGGVAVLAGFAGAACGSKKSGFTSNTPANPGNIGGDGGVLAGNGDGGACNNRCSSDLHSVLDCDGNVLKTCPADQGCGGTDCVAACDSARLNASSIGCDFYGVDPDVIEISTGGCYAAFVVNNWPSPVTIAVDRDGQQFDATGFARIPSGSGQSLTYAPLPGGALPAGQVAILFLARNGTQIVDCPAGITPAYTTASANLRGTGLGKAFHITTSAPVVAYDVYPYGGGQSAMTSSTMLLPTSAWDTNYIAASAYPRSQFWPTAQPTLDIVASEDQTTVSIKPVTNVVGGNGVAAANKGQPTSYLLSKGDILQLSQDIELTGSPIQSDKPIGVWGGSTCLNIAIDKKSADAAHQQIPPVRALGHEYAAVRYRSRFDDQDESVPWRIVGAVDGTTLTYEPAPPSGAPLSVNLGAVVEFRTTDPFVVKSQDDQHPFYMAAYMTGGEETNPALDDERGDPEFVNVVPPQQFMTSYVFFTDPTYPETNVVLVRAKAKDGFKDVGLDCAGILSGWQPLGTSGDYEWMRTDLVRHNFQKQGNCDNGRHEIKSDAPFGITVWGWGSAETGGSPPSFTGNGSGFYSQAVSYAYPAGASVQPINTVVVTTVK